MSENTDGRALVIAELIRIHGPTKALALVREADKAREEGRAPDYSLILAPSGSEGERA